MQPGLDCYMEEKIFFGLGVAARESRRTTRALSYKKSEALSMLRFLIEITVLSSRPTTVRLCAGAGAW